MGYLLFEESNSSSCIHCIEPFFMCLICIFSVSASFCKTIMQIQKHHSRGDIIPVELLDGGTGMIASSNTFPSVGCFVRHRTEALVYSNHPRAAAASSYLAIIFGRIASGVPWFLRSTAEPMQHPHQCWR